VCVQAVSAEEHHTDLHMLRVTKELQAIIKGGDFAIKQKKELEKVRVCVVCVFVLRELSVWACVCMCVCAVSQISIV